MKITVCIGSSCHLKGSKEIVDQLQELIGQMTHGGRIAVEHGDRPAFGGQALGRREPDPGRRPRHDHRSILRHGGRLLFRAVLGMPSS